MCSLPSDGTLRTEIDQKTIDKYFSPELKYSCMFWALHVMKSDDTALLAREGFKFLHDHFLHWLEAMNLFGVGSEVISIIRQLKSKTMGNSDIYGFLREGERFALKNQYISDKAPLQIYTSSLIFAPKKSIFRDLYRHETPRWIIRLPEVNESWDVGLRQLEGHKEEYDGREEDSDYGDHDHHIAFSNDGQMIASCLGSISSPFYIPDVPHTIRVWHTATGVFQQAFRPRLDLSHGKVSSIAFSPDDQLLACRYNDGTVAICDLAQHAVVNTLLLPDLFSVIPHHSGFHPNEEINSWMSSISSRGWKVAFSRVGEPIQVCSLLTCEKTHQSSFNKVGPVAISYDGRLVASCLSYKVVHNARPSVPRFSTGNDSEVSVHRGTKPEPMAGIITTCKIWDTIDDTTEVMGSPFSHNEAQSSQRQCDYKHWPRLTFSPNNQILAVESFSFIEIWDVPNKALKWNLTGSSDVVAFSFDSTLLASGTNFNTIHIWNLASGTLQHVFRDYGALVSISFSPHGNMLASSLRDGRIQLRDLDMISEEVDLDAFNRVEHGDERHQVISAPLDFPGPKRKSLFSIPNVSTNLKDSRVHLSPTPCRICLGTVSSDCRLLVTFAYTTATDRGEFIQLWDINEGRYLRRFDMHIPMPGSKFATISHGNEVLAIGHQTRRFEGITSTLIEVFEISTGTYRCSIPAHGGGVSFLSFSPSGRTLFAAHKDGTFSLWCTTHGWTTHTTSIDFASATMPRFELSDRLTVAFDPLIAFSQNGLLAYTGSNDDGRSNIRICDTISGSTHHVLRSQSSEFQLLVFSPDNQLLAAATVDKKVYIWDVDSGLLRYRFEEREFVIKLQFTGDSSTLILHLRSSSYQLEEHFAHLKSRPGNSIWNIRAPLSADGEWISYKGENILWLPSEFRPNFGNEVVDNILIMSHLGGRLSFMGFDLTHLPGFIADTEVRRDLRDIEKQAEGNDQRMCKEGL